MKTLTKIITLVFALGTAKNISAQASMDLFGVIPVKNCGWGFGGKIFTPGASLGNLEVRLGGGIYGSSMVRRTMTNVPLNAPQTGDATVKFKNGVWGFDGILRFSLPYSSGLVPYFDAFVGSRLFTANMNIIPNVQNNTYQNSTFQNLSSLSQLNYGGELGVMFSFSDNFKFNAGMMYTYSPKFGEVVDVDKITLDNGSLTTQNMSTPHGVWIAKVGFVFAFGASSGGSGGGGGVGGRSRGLRLGGGGGAKIGGGGGGLRNGIRLNLKPKT